MSIHHKFSPWQGIKTLFPYSSALISITARHDWLTIREWLEESYILNLTINKVNKDLQTSYVTTQEPNYELYKWKLFWKLTYLKFTARKS